MGHGRVVLTATAILIAVVVIPASAEAHIEPAFVETMAEAGEEPGPGPWEITDDTGPHSHGGGGGGGSGSSLTDSCSGDNRTGLWVGPVGVCAAHDVQAQQALDDLVDYATGPPVGCGLVCLPSRTDYADVQVTVVADAVQEHCFEAHHSDISRSC